MESKNKILKESIIKQLEDRKAELEEEISQINLVIEQTGKIGINDCSGESNSTTNIKYCKKYETDLKKKKVQELLKEGKYTLKEIAEKVGCCTASIYNWGRIEELSREPVNRSEIAKKSYKKKWGEGGHPMKKKKSAEVEICDGCRNQVESGGFIDKKFYGSQCGCWAKMKRKKNKEREEDNEEENDDGE